MSGVEVAGLVLGCLPLLIQGIESYNEGLDPIKSFMRWERELPQFIRKLRNQHVHYAQTIRILFEPITTELELAQMMSNPGSTELWKGKHMVEKLQERLHESYQAYQGTIVDIERITKKIASKLDIDRASELSRNDLEAILAANPKKANDKFEFGKRVRFGMNKKAIKALLEELDDCNKELERFTEKSEKIETYRKSVKPAFASRLQRIQGYAKSLHDSLLWSCTCKSSHKTSLQLEPRGNLFANGMKKTSKTTFTVSFTTVATTTDESDGPWTWQAAEILVDEEDLSSTPLSSPKPRMSKSVSFSSPPPYSVDDPGADLSLSSSSLSMQEVKDLCASIKQIRASRLGFSLDSRSKLRGACSIDSSEIHVPSVGVLTLEDLLDRPPVVDGRRAKLSKKERYSLALTLASSVLYLNSTPWLTDQWAAKDILFHRTAASARPVNIDRPHVAPALVELPKLPNGQKARGFHNKNTVLLALAIALLELYFGTSAMKYQENEHGATDPSLHKNPWMLCSMAHNWAEESQEDLSAAFLSAVRHCLRCFSDPGASLQDSEFLQAAVESIVLPLQEELHQFLGTAAA